VLDLLDLALGDVLLADVAALLEHGAEREPLGRALAEHFLDLGAGLGALDAEEEDVAAVEVDRALLAAGARLAARRGVFDPERARALAAVEELEDFREADLAELALDRRAALGRGHAAAPVAQVDELLLIGRGREAERDRGLRISDRIIEAAGLLGGVEALLVLLVGQAADALVEERVEDEPHELERRDLGEGEEVGDGAAPVEEVVRPLRLALGARARDDEDDVGRG